MIKIIKVIIFILISTLGWLFQSNQVFCDSNFSKPTFTITTSDLTPIWADKLDWWTLEEKADDLLLKIIKLLMVSIWVISLLVVTIWAGYMIFYNWKEEFLTKWRNMIYTWFLALFIALCSYYLMNLVSYILYS